MEKMEKAMDFLKSIHMKSPIEKFISVFGWEKDGTYKYNLYSSVNMYLNEPLSITESLVPEGSINRPGILKKSINYITIHDTGSAFPTATAKAHDSYVRSGGNGTSWHYSVGNDGIFRQIPDIEVAFHAGDGSREFLLHDTFIKATSDHPKVSISEDGFYRLDGIQTIIKAPLNEEGELLSDQSFSDSGIKITVGENGNWNIGDTWYSKFYKKIGNSGGNRNSIGIESCVNRGSDIYLTWQRLAKLTAFLLDKHQLSFSDIVQHNFFSGKDCPMTMRHCDMWNHFIELVKVEYKILTEFKNYKISFISNSPYIAGNGRIIDLPKENTTETYIIHIESPEGKIIETGMTVNLPYKKA